MQRAPITFRGPGRGREGRLNPGSEHLSSHTSTGSLEMSELASLSLFPATPDQLIASRKRSSVEWARGLTLEQYLHRDAILEVMEHAVKGKLTTW
jgi:hypothetical protein